MVIVLDLQQKESFARKKQNRDKFEKNKAFSNKTSQNYRKLAKKKRWRIVNASQTKQQVHQDVMKIVTKDGAMKEKFLEITDPIHDFIRRIVQNKKLSTLLSFKD